jgi:tellurite resistance protein
LEKEGIGEDALEALLGNFLRGLESDEKGGRLWKEKYVDQAGAGDVSAGEENTEFTAEEFAILKRSLFHVLFLVARADGKVDKGEVESLAKIVQDPERFGSPLLNRIATNVIEEFSGWFLVVSMGESDYNLEELAKARVMVDAKLSVEASRAFKAALLAVGNEVANAAGGFFSKVSKEERATLASIASALGVSSS